MSITEFSIKNPYMIITLSVAIVILGVISFFNTPVDLFPDTTPPQILIITVEPGASADDVSDKITQIIEKEVNTISGIKRVRATSRDEVSSVLTEFYYTKDINEAVTDVVNALERIKANLPKDIMPNQIYKISDATHATMTIALSPQPGSGRTLDSIRLLAENDIKDAFLRIKEIGDVDIFGGYIPEIKILINRDKLKGYNLTLVDIINEISQRNVSIPGGYIYGTEKEYLVKTDTEFKNLDEIKNLPIKQNAGGYIYLKDVASIKQGVREKRSLYHGNGHPAIALNILRTEKGHTLATIRAAKKLLSILKKRYPDIQFEITNDQQPILDINLKGMRGSLGQAIILTIMIIFLFLADRRAAAIISVSIPMSFLFSLMVLKFSPYTINMVTLSGLIIAVGMVVDASIVVLENIFRHFNEDKTLTGTQAAILGTKEVTLANTAGMLTTVIVLFPVMFTGGYPQKVLRQLSIIIGSTIFASLIASLTIVPLIASHILTREKKKKSVFERFVGNVDKGVKKISMMYISVLELALRHKRLTIMLTMITLVLTMRIVAPLLIGELMPPMDTGIVKVAIDIPSDENINKVEDILSKVEAIIQRTEGYVSLSSVIGSEPGQTSFGQGGATVQQAFITVNLVTRDKRKTTIWEIEDDWRRQIRNIAGILSFTVVEFGATPISTTKAPFDFIIRGKNTDVLNTLADTAIENLKGTEGLVDIRRAWNKNKTEIILTPDAKQCQYYGVSTKDVAEYIKIAVKGMPVSSMRLEGFLDIPILVEYDNSDMNSLNSIGSVYIPTHLGQIPLRNFIKIEEHKIQPFITREDLENTIDITGVNRIATIAQAASNAGKHLKKGMMVLPDGYSVRMSGTPENMANSKRRLGKSLLFGIILLYLLIVPMYKSFSHPLVIMSAIPLAAIGAFWGLLIFDKPMCMPAFMGMILLAGTIINNSILLLDFILEARKKGIPRDEAIIQSVRIRTRPILMTASSTVIGLTPLVFEMAVGLERLSPLGIVASCGLLLGTFLTMVVIPVIYATIDDLKNKLFGNKTAVHSRLAVLLFFLSTYLLMFVFGSNAVAQSTDKKMSNPSVPKIFDINQAIDYALTHSPSVDKTEADTILAEGGRISRLSGLLPQFDALGSYTYYHLNHPVVPGVVGKKQRFDNNLVTAEAQGSILITDFGKTYYAYQASKDAYLASLLSVERRKEAIVFNVANLYFEIHSIKRLIEAFRIQYNSLAELKRRMNLFLKDGRIAEVDLLKINVQLASIADQIQRLDSKKIFLLSRLAEEIGWEGDIDIKNIMSVIEYNPDTTSADVIFYHALEHRRDFKTAQVLVDSAKEQLISSKRSYLPQIRAVGRAGEFSGFSGDSKFAGNERWEGDNWFGATVSFPIFDGGMRHGQILQSKGSYKKRLAQEQIIRLGIYKDIKKAIADIDSATKRIELARESQTEALEALRVENLKYKDGKGLINDTLDAESAVRQAQALLYEAIADYNTGVFELELAKGDLLEKYNVLIRIDSKKADLSKSE